MTVYVVYVDYGSCEGCKEPEGVFSTEEKAALYIYNHDYTGGWLKIKELVLDEKTS